MGRLLIILIVYSPLVFEHFVNARDDDQEAILAALEVIIEGDLYEFENLLIKRCTVAREDLQLFGRGKWQIDRLEILEARLHHPQNRIQHTVEHLLHDCGAESLGRKLHE